MAKGSRRPGDKTFFGQFPPVPPAAQMATLFQAIDEGGPGQFPAQFFPRYLGTTYLPITC